MRAYEKTVLTFGIVQIPVALYKASAKDTLKLRTLHECGTPLKRPFVCPTHDNVQVPMAEQMKGYEFQKGEFLTFTPEEVKAARSVESSGFEEFKAVDFKALATEYILDSPYHVLPENEDAATLKGFALVRGALLEGGLALVGKFNSHKRARNVALVASKNEPSIMLYTLTEKRPVPFVPEDGNPTEHEASLMSQLIQTLASDDVTVEPVEDPLLKMVEAKMAGAEHTSKMVMKKAVMDLEELLQKSVDAAK